jgi:hypothetical protein
MFELVVAVDDPPRAVSVVEVHDVVADEVTRGLRLAQRVGEPALQRLATDLVLPDAHVRDEQVDHHVHVPRVDGHGVPVRQLPDRGQ